ncbi:membrane protein insertion efficiency factor YidD [Epibacterium sp. DP7N7-1]|nr:membrane protein insertion efficiency factor YidD [Epibacterium sp. DP7N7-1]
MLTALSLGAIGFYQKLISPHKGFSCAYRVAHGGTGCSGYIKNRIIEVGLLRAIPDIRARFSDCRTAADDLNARRRRRDERSIQCLDAVDCGCNCGPSACGLTRSARGAKSVNDSSDCGDVPGCCGLF